MKLIQRKSESQIVKCLRRFLILSFLFSIASDGGQPGRYKCPDCVKSFAFAGSFFMHRKEHLKCKKCGEEFQTEAGLSDHNRKCEYDVAESPSKADVELNGKSKNFCIAYAIILELTHITLIRNGSKTTSSQ